jgi:hypothetical protein
MTTIEDAINAQIQYCRKRKNDAHSAVFNRSMDTWIEVLKSAPRDLAEIQKLIERRDKQLKAASTWEKQDAIIDKLDALDWLRMILKCSAKERESWDSSGNATIVYAGTH